MHETEIIILEKHVSKQSFPIKLFQWADRKPDANWQVIIVIAISAVSWVLACDLALRMSSLSWISFFTSTAFSLLDVHLAFYRPDGYTGRNKSSNYEEEGLGHCLCSGTTL